MPKTATPRSSKRSSDILGIAAQRKEQSAASWAGKNDTIAGYQRAEATELRQLSRRRARQTTDSNNR